MVAVGNSTFDGSVLFAKNSDREPNETQELVTVPRLRHYDGESVRCSYIRIPQVRETFAVFLAKPFWIWGAEMGANEQGVTIGNEALFTKMPNEKKPGLIGMDLLRLALERADSARRALTVITELLARYGQTGNCGFSIPSYYHNSYIISDLEEAWVLETSGRNWAAKKVQDIYCISNAITIEKDWDLASSRLIDDAIEKGWCKNKKDFSFAHCYTNHYLKLKVYATHRHNSATEYLKQHQGKIDLRTLMAATRLHDLKKTDEQHFPSNMLGLNVCMHFGVGPIKECQTTGSMVSKSKAGECAIWATCSSMPCMSIYKPIWIESGVPASCESGNGCQNNESIWWQHEIFNRNRIFLREEELKQYKSEINLLENSFIDAAEQLERKSLELKRELTGNCFEKDKNLILKWNARLKEFDNRKLQKSMLVRKIHRLNREAELAIVSQ